jgi:type II secretion system protein J
MIAVAIFAVVSGIVFPALIQFLDMRERVYNKQQQIIALQKTFLFFANDLRYATNRLGKNEYGDRAKTILKVDDSSLMELSASYPDVNFNGENIPRRVRWQLDDGVLQRVQYPVMDPDGDTHRYVQTLITEVRAVALQTHKAENSRVEESHRWEDPLSLPDMIEIEIELESGQKYRRAFTLVTASEQQL